MEPTKVVARYRDGRVIKGYTHDFSPERPRFHLSPATAAGGSSPVEIWIRDLKAVFFVRDFAGNPAHDERKEFADPNRTPGRKLEVTLADGEVVVGSSLGYGPQRPGFFLVPADPASNNLRIFVPTAVVTKLRML
jgi:hypothetical protein